MADPLIQIPFNGGPNETIAQQLAPLGTVLSARNQVYDADGEYQLRYGYTVLSTTAPATVLKLAGLNSELLAVDGQNLWSFDSTANAWVEKDVVPAMGVTHAPLQNSTSSYESWGEAVSNDYRVVAWTIADAPHAGTNVTGLAATVYSRSTGAQVLNTMLTRTVGDTGTPVHIHVGVIGTTAIVTVSTTTAIYAWSLSLSPLGTWSAATKISDANYLGNTVYACAFLSDRFVIAYEVQITTTGGGSTTVTYYLEKRAVDATLSVVATNLTATGYSDTLSGTLGWGQYACMAAGGTSGEAVWVACDCAFVHPASGDDAIFVAAFDTSSLAPLSTNTPYPLVTLGTGALVTSRMVIGRIDSTTCLLAANSPSITDDIGYESGNRAPGTMFVQVGINAMATAMLVLPWFWIASQPVYVASLGTHLMYMRQPQYGPAAPNTGLFTNGTYPVFNLQGSYYLVDLLTNLTWSPVDLSGALPTPRLLTILAPRIVNIGDDSSESQYESPAIVATSDTTYETVMPIERGVGRQGLDIFTIDFGANYRWSTATLGRETYLSGGYYDGGGRFVETGYATKPVCVAASDYTGHTYTWEYVATFVRVDTQGNVEESAPSDALQVTSTSSTPSFTIKVTDLSLTQKQRWSDDQIPTGGGTTVGQSSYIYVRLYRTQELSAGNTLHYAIAEFPLPSGQLNLVGGKWLSISDSASDTSISTNTVLYTDSGELAHNAPESPTHIAVHKNALVAIGADQRSIWFSQVYSDGALPAWNETNILTADDAGEPLIATASLYDKLLVFTEGKLYVIYGDWPSPAGTGSSLQAAQRIPSPAGCIDPRSVVNTPMGVMFQSRRGIEIVDTGMNVEFIGLPVSVTTASYPICTSAVYDDRTSTVRFSFVTSEAIPATGSGVLVLYDVRRQRWAVHSLTAGAHAGSAVDAPVQCAYVHPLYGYVEGHNDVSGGSYAVIARENTSADPYPWIDHLTHFVPLSVTTAWYKPNDTQGWGRVRRVHVLASYYDAHGLSATFNTDYRSNADTHAYTSNLVGTFVRGSQEQVRFAPVNAQCESMQVTVTTVEPVSPQVIGSGRACGFLGLAFEAKPAGGAYRRRAPGAES